MVKLLALLPSFQVLVVLLEHWLKTKHVKACLFTEKDACNIRLHH